MKKYSIVIPTHNHYDDFLRPNLESIVKYTDLDQTEIIVVANACSDNTVPQVRAMSESFPIKLLDCSSPLGYTKATNEGIKVSTGDFVILLNNDTVLLEQSKNDWINILKDPFNDPNVGITGPVKFKWPIGNTMYTAMAFWCVMISRAVFNKIGILDEVFSPGMGEDGDFSIRAEQAGFSLVQVPERLEAHLFGQGTSSGAFPIYHHANGTFNEDQTLKNKIIERNNKILLKKYGKQNEADWLEEIYQGCCQHPNDINEHFPVLRQLTEECNHVTEMGVRDVFSTYAFLAGRPKTLRCYDIYQSPDITKAESLATIHNTDFKFLKESTIATVIEPTDMLFIDTRHTYDQLRQELNLHSGKVSKYILIHDTEAYGTVGEEGEEGLNKAWEEFIQENNEWRVKNRYVNNNGLTVLERVTKVKYSVVIPTYNHLEDLLMPCIQSIIQYTDLKDIEVIVVANGCTDGTKTYLSSLPPAFKTLWFDEGLGYTKATNEGIKVAKGEYVILLNNDTVLLDQPINQWIDKLYKPFTDPTVGITGPLVLHDAYADRDVLIFFCVMILKTVFDKIGLLDEIYSPGGGEDIDFCAKLQDIGYRCVRIPEDTNNWFDSEKLTNSGDFPLWHKAEGTFSEEEIPEYGREIIKRNGLINCKKYNKHIKLDLGCGPVIQPGGYLGVDLKGKQCNILMDITKLDFDNNSVEEIIASHVLEHISPFFVLRTLIEWHRVLKPGGKLILELPHVIKLCEAIAKANKAERYGLITALHGAVNTEGNNPEEITSPHLWSWEPEALGDHLWNAGFIDIVAMEDQIPHPHFNFRMECRKPE